MFCLLTKNILLILIKIVTQLSLIDLHATLSMMKIYVILCTYIAVLIQ